MELILAIFVAGPLGYVTRSRRRGLTLYLVAWAIVLPIQTAVVYATGDQSLLYWLLNALILAVGIGLNRLGAKLGERRRAHARSAPHAA